MNNNMCRSFFGAVLALFFVTDANATLSISSGGGASGTENVLFNSCMSDPAMTVTGALNQSGLLVDFTGNEDLIAPSCGQSRITAAIGTFDYLEVEMRDPGLGFDKIVFNLDFLDPTGPMDTLIGFVTITLMDQFMNMFDGTFEIDRNGSNFFTGLGEDGQVIQNVTIEATVAMVGISDIAQVRIGAAALPEPGTLSLLAIGLVGAAWVRRRKLA